MKLSERLRRLRAKGNPSDAELADVEDHARSDEVALDKAIQDYLTRQSLAMRPAKEWLMDPEVDIGNPEGHFADMTADLPETMSRRQALQWVLAIQANAFEAGAADMRARAKAYCDETAVMLGPNGGGIAHRMGIDIGELPLTAPSAGVPVDEPSGAPTEYSDTDDTGDIG